MWHRDPKIARLKALERAELDAATEEWARNQLRERGLIDRVSSRLGHWAERVKGVARFLGALGTLASAGAWLYHRMRATEPPVAELPATGQPTIGTDFVPEPKIPKP